MQVHRGKTDSRRARAAAWLWQPVQGLVALFDVQPLLTMALIIPMCVHVLDLWRFGKGESLQTPLKEVGFRELGLSAAVSVLAIAALW